MMRLVYIKPEWRDTDEPPELYRVLTDPNANGRVDIEPVNWDYAILSIESVYLYMLEDAQ